MGAKALRETIGRFRRHPPKNNLRNCTPFDTNPIGTEEKTQKHNQIQRRTIIQMREVLDGLQGS